MNADTIRGVVGSHGLLLRAASAYDGLTLQEAWDLLPLSDSDICGHEGVFGDALLSNGFVWNRLWRKYVRDGPTVWTWRELIAEEMYRHGEWFEDVVSSVGSKRPGREFEIDPSDAWMDAGLFGDGGHFWPFCLWTENRIYFPCSYDDGVDIWVRSVSRTPDDVPIYPVDRDTNELWGE